MSEESFDLFYKNGTHTTTYSQLGFGSLEEFKKSITEGGIINRKTSTSDLRNVISIV